jgi:hypothetical protein
VNQRLCRAALDQLRIEAGSTPKAWADSGARVMPAKSVTRMRWTRLMGVGRCVANYGEPIALDS